MPTTNPVPSTDPTDLLFNAGKLDEVVNGAYNSFTDRLGIARRTVAGMNADFDAQLADAESDLNVYRADAAASAAEALGYLNDLKGRWYGARSSDPTTDPLGLPIGAGDAYFNTMLNQTRVYSGTAWQAPFNPTDSSQVAYQPTTGAATVVQERLRDYEAELLAGSSPALVSRTGPAGEPNTIVGPAVASRIASYATACHLQAGTNGLPNMIGWQYDYRRVQGSGSAVFVITFTFPVSNTSWSPRVTSIRRSDNIYTPVTANSITGYGTNTLTITLSAPLASTHDLFVQVDGDSELNQSDPNSNPRLSNILSGYNNRTTQLMNVVNGAHNRAVGSDGHNTILGGSNNLVLGGSYHTIGGTNVITGERDPAGSGVIAIGQNLVADGTGAVNFGFSNKAYGNYSISIGGTNDASVSSAVAIGYGNAASAAGAVAIGYTSTASASYAVAIGLSCVSGGSYSTVFGRENTASAGSYSMLCGYKNETALASTFVSGTYGKARNTAQSVIGLGGAVVGSRQASRAYAAGQTTSSAIVGLTKTGGATISCHLDSAVSIRGRIIGRDKNNADAAVFDVDAMLVINAAGTTTIVGGGTNTLKYSSAALAGVTSTLLAGTAGVQVRVAGVDGRTINWVAVLDVVEIGADAQ